MDNLLRDLRFAFRSLARSRGFAAIAVVTLTLAIGATTAVYSVVYAALFRSPPFAEADRLMLPYITRSVDGGRPQLQRWSFPRYQMLRREQRSFSDLATFGPSSLNLTAGIDPERLSSEQVSAGYFATLRVRPLLGRVFLQEEDSIPGVHPAAVLG